MSVPAQKITFAEMRAVGVRRVLVYCSIIAAATRRSPTPIDGPMTSGCPILRRGSPAVAAVPMFGRIGRR
jgi:hypothetical protein